MCSMLCNRNPISLFHIRVTLHSIITKSNYLSPLASLLYIGSLVFFGCCEFMLHSILLFFTICYHLLSSPLDLLYDICYLTTWCWGISRLRWKGICWCHEDLGANLEFGRFPRRDDNHQVILAWRITWTSLVATVPGVASGI